jgi:hypothetical protein
VLSSIASGFTHSWCYSLSTYRGCCWGLHTRTLLGKSHQQVNHCVYLGACTDVTGGCRVVVVITLCYPFIFKSLINKSTIAYISVLALTLQAVVVLVVITLCYPFIKKSLINKSTIAYISVLALTLQAVVVLVVITLCYPFIFKSLINKSTIAYISVLALTLQAVFVSVVTTFSSIFGVLWWCIH